MRRVLLVSGVAAAVVVGAVWLLLAAVVMEAGMGEDWEDSDE